MLRRKLAPSREAAKREIEAGRVTVGGAPVSKPARLVSPADSIQMLGPPARFVSRAGQKLDGALHHFGIQVAGLRAVDAGSSTGGFTDCLIQSGAAHVVAVDVGTHQLHERLRGHPKVTLFEQTDIRRIRLDKAHDQHDSTAVPIGPAVDIVVGDLSFISLGVVLETLFSLVKPGGELVLLVKPQFEAGRQEVSRGNGVISDPAIWRRVLDEVWTHVAACEGAMLGAMVSPITGRTGNVEFILHLSARSTASEPMRTVIDHETAFERIVSAATPVQSTPAEPTPVEATE